ncbi:unnamed protein product [Rotaria magnacalcarata]|uniref:ABC transporter domain-containing protein n=2 Tax=Rotaria magnacalcarata TaxID=392030 RepID=A0A8S3B180_9BILA|nr:unnamed protein product [Rotaria magnacalcarata]
MCIFFVLTCIATLLSKVGIKGTTDTGVSKTVFNGADWTVVWTVLFVYSIEVSVFAVFFGQLFKRPPVGLRYFLCFLPNAGLLFCIQVMQQYDRRSGGTASMGDLYTNIFQYKLYVGLYLLVMLIYSVMYFFLAIYVERLNPGEFGVAQRWNYLFQKSYWKPSIVSPIDSDDDFNIVNNGVSKGSNWMELDQVEQKKSPTMRINHLNKTFDKFQAVSDLSLEFFEGEVCTLLGHNGAGKTTTTFILVGM